MYVDIDCMAWHSIPLYFCSSNKTANSQFKKYICYDTDSTNEIIFSMNPLLKSYANIFRITTLSYETYHWNICITNTQVNHSIWLLSRAHKAIHLEWGNLLVQKYKVANNWVPRDFQHKYFYLSRSIITTIWHDVNCFRLVNLALACYNVT